MANKRDIRVDFIADASKFIAGIRTVTADLGGFERKAGGAASKIKDAFSSLLPALTAGGIALYFDNVSQAVSEATAKLDNLAKGARRLGLASDQLQTIRIQAEAAGIQTSVLDTAFQRFARRVGQGTLDKTFKELNISIRDSAGNLKTNFNLWNEFGRKISQVEDENRQLALAMSAVDTEGVKLVELWRTSKEGIDEVNKKIEEYGLIFDQNILDKAEAYQTELGLIKRAQEAVDVITAASLTEQSLQWEKLKLKISQAKFELLAFFGAFGVRPDDDKTRAIKLISEQKILNAQLKVLRDKRLTAETEAEKKAIDDRIEYAENSLKRNEKRRRELLNKLEETQDKGSSGPAGIPDRGTDKQKTKGKSDADRFADTLRRLEDRLDPAGQKTRELYENIALLDKAFANGSISADRYDFLITELTTDTKALAKEQERLAKDKELALGFISDLDPTSSLKAQILEVQRLREEFETLSPAIADSLADVELVLNEKIDDVLNDIKDKTDEVEDSWKDLGLTFTSAFEDAIVEGKNLSEVMKGLEKDIARIITRKLVTEPLTAAVSGAFSGGGLFGDLFGGLFGPARAGGGPVMAGKIHPVGERGPELFVPGSNGTIIPNNKIGGSTVNVYLTPPPGTSPEALRLSARQGALEGSRMLGKQRSIN